MPRWLDLYGVVAEYISDVIDVTSDFDYLLSTISHNYVNNDGVIALDMKVSLDGGNVWTQWINVNNGSYSPLFDGNEFPLYQVKIQYKVTMDISNNMGGITPEFDFFKLKLDGAYKIYNYGDMICKPLLWIKKTNGSGSIKLTNESNGMTLELKDLNNGETVFIDCENEDIATDLPLKYRYNDHNNVYLEFMVGENLISGEGDFELDMRYQFKTLQG